MIEQGETAVAANMADAKCPYLAGRPPHGTFKLWPSSINVCYGRPAEGKAYGHVSKDTQGQKCFGGESLFCECPHFQQAQAALIEPPEFGRAIKVEAEPVADTGVHRVRKRRRKKHSRKRELAPLLRTIAFVTVLLATIALVGMVLMK